jgi:hypothetical protein
LLQGSGAKQNGALKKWKDVYWLRRVPVHGALEKAQELNIPFPSLSSQIQN